MHDTPKQKPLYYENVTITPKEGSEVEIVGEIPVDQALIFRAKAVRTIRRELELPGFRKGHVPEEMVVQHVGETKIMQEAVELGLADVYPRIVEDNSLDVVGQPKVSITKLAPGNPIGFTITSGVYPTVTLPDYMKIAKEEAKAHTDSDEAVVKDDELNAELERLRSMFATPGQKEEGAEDAQPVLPELNDDFVKQLGDFSSVEDLKNKMREQLVMQKKEKAREKRRLAIANAVISKSKLDVPEVFIEGELDQMVASFEERVVRAGMTMEAYLEQSKKTTEEIRKEWRPDAEKRAKLQIIFNEIAKKEDIRPDAKKLDREVNHVKEHYPDANERSVRVYVLTQMVNELVFRTLEGEDVASVEKSDA
jgi:FKBP-type peptidyl-prolyl cis-trans isomerase (trigger factor)